ncbi:hypothetical protein [Microbacterium sp. TPD7012]|uniref:hypothetical protein n=1 Tax=Microbacterium sp. TPD7012 TaxID=2171975 RepID=UPI000D51CEF5|nr:hypothetical protein [Microbacterium sp. TPD7012]PVE98621.1 hypothetical protein DC434_04050 [Microbacterium sp. TPD7012]
MDHDELVRLRGSLTPLTEVDAAIPDTCSNLWLRNSGADPWEYDVILMDTSEGFWTYKRDARVNLPSDEILWERDGIRYLRPDAIHWLRSALTTAHPGHPWITLLDR